MTVALRVHFDQNCMNARGTDAELRAIQGLHDRGTIVLVANVRNRWELGEPQRDGRYQVAARARLERFEESQEYFRFNVSPMGSVTDPAAGAVCSSVTDAEPLSVSAVWRVVFPDQVMPSGLEGRSVLERGQNSINDVMHLVNAHDWGADVFLTADGAVLQARERLYTEVGFRPRIESPSELLRRFPASPEDPT
jgi:hypothetical protein